MTATLERCVVGVDLGQAHDPTAICAVKKAGEIYQVGYLQRMPLGTTYPAIVAHVGALLRRLPGNPELVIDATGVGKPVFDMFVGAGVAPIGVMITGGSVETSAGHIHNVPKLTLISRIQSLLHEGTLKILRTLPEAETLVRELQDYRTEYSPTGHLTFNARVGRHDDLLLALAVAAWRAARPTLFVSEALRNRMRGMQAGGAR